MMNRSRQYILSMMLLAVIISITAAHSATENSYKAERDKYINKSKNNKNLFSQQDMDIMAKAAKDLAKTLPNPGIKVSETAPDFTLGDAYDGSVRLSDELKKGPVVLVFYRGAWCPFCNMHLRSLQKALPEIKQHNAQLILVTPQKPDKSVEQFKKEKVDFKVLSDLENKVMKAYKLYYKLDADLVAVYKKHGLDVEAFNGKGRNELPVPGTFVINKGGKVIAMHADTDYMQRMEPADILVALESINK